MRNASRLPACWTTASHLQLTCLMCGIGGEAGVSFIFVGGAERLGVCVRCRQLRRLSVADLATNLGFMQSAALAQPFDGFICFAL